MKTVLNLADFDAVTPDTLEATLDQHIAAIDSTIDTLVTIENPTWEALITPLDKVMDALSKFWSPVSHLNSVLQTDALRDAYQACLPKLSELYTRIGQNQELFKAYQKLKASSAFTSYDEERQATINKAIEDFELSGVGLDAEKKARFAELSSELSQLNSQFSNNILDATQAWTYQTSDKEELAGIPGTALALFEQQAQIREQEGYVITLDIPCYLPVMKFADNPALREKVYSAFSTRASELSQEGKFDNTDIMQTILEKRHEKAQLLGFATYAELSLAKKMADSTDDVLGFLNNLADKSVAKAKAEFAELQAFAKELDGSEQLNAWDVSYYSEKLKEQRYQLNQEQLKTYFPYPNVANGLFTVVEKLFGLKVEADKDVPTYHEDATFYKLLNKDGELIAGFYLDPFARQHKRGGAWMDSFSSRHQDDTELELPVAYLTCNFTPPVGDTPSLLTHDEVTTLFHEFGHGLHHMLTQVNVSDVAGINGVEWDAVELPSQLLENWCWEEEGLSVISAHVDTQEPLPQDLLQQMLAAKNYHSAMMMVRQLEFSLFDMKIHAQDPNTDGFSVQGILDAVRDDVAAIEAPSFNRFAQSFGHIFAGGYAAGYYSYKWAEVLSADFFTVFNKEGIFNQETGLKYLDCFLAQGSVKPAAKMCEDFLGRKPDVEALLKQEGIIAA